MLGLLLGGQVLMTWRYGWRGLAIATSAAVFLPMLLLVLLHASADGHFDFGGVSLAKSWAHNTTLGGYVCMLLSPFIAFIAAILLAFAVKTE